MILHLSERAAPILGAELTKIQDQCFNIMKEYSSLFSKKERAFLTEKIKSKAIPTPRLLIKDHKKKRSDGNFDTRLVVPATNFTAGFSKISYMGIKKLLDKNNVWYGKHNIVQAVDLKEELEFFSDEIKKGQSTIISINAEAMYPSIKYGLIEKAIWFYARDLSDDEKETIKNCLQLLKFGMSTTLLSFCDKYYLYDGDLEIQNRGLTIGGYESAWLADLAMSYLLDNSKDIINDSNLIYFGIYRDDGIGVFKGKSKIATAKWWLDRLQRRINKIAGNDFLKFTMEIWRSDVVVNEDGLNDKRITINRDEYFPFLDMKLSWNMNGSLDFGVHLKPNQELKYLNKGSAHTPSCFKAVSTGVMKRLTKLTSVTKENCNLKLDKIYPLHFEALNKADLLKNVEIPSLAEKKKEMEDERKNPTLNKVKKRRERDRKRAIYFKIGFSNFWIQPVHKIIKKHKNKFTSLNWLRVSMSYHRFTNFREHLQGDLTTKLNEGIDSEDFQTLQCNCRNKKKCIYGGRCRSSIVVYQATCSMTGKKYIGNTQQHVKTRLQQHVQDVRRLVKLGEKSDSFAEHFASLIPGDPAEKKKKKIAEEVKFEVKILWKGNPISCVKTFGTKKCKLCSKERIEILKATRKDQKSIINKNNEIYGACRHKPRFHKFCRQTAKAKASTDESVLDERAPVLFPPQSTNSYCSFINE